MQLRIPVHAESLGVLCSFSVFDRDEGSRVTYFEGETDTDITPRRVFAIPGHPFRQPGSPLAPVARSLSGALNLLHVKNTDEGDTKKRQEHIRIIRKDKNHGEKILQKMIKSGNRRFNSTYTIRLRGPVSQSVRAFHPRGLHLHQCGETAAQSTDGVPNACMPFRFKDINIVQDSGCLSSLHISSSLPCRVCTHWVTDSTTMHSRNLLKDIIL